jgi:hypothetical protein
MSRKKNWFHIRLKGAWEIWSLSKLNKTERRRKEDIKTSTHKPNDARSCPYVPVPVSAAKCKKHSELKLQVPLSSLRN